MGPSAKAEQKERRALTGSNTTTTFHQQAMIDLQLESGGRFSKDTIVSGTEASVPYPAGPAWTRDQVGIEPPLGVAIDDLEPTGNAHEIEHSLSVAAPVVPIIHDRQSADLPSSAETSAGWPQRRDENGVAANPSAEERLAQILPKIAVPIVAPPKRRRV
jgi:hypothetical protein